MPLPPVAGRKEKAQAHRLQPGPALLHDPSGEGHGPQWGGGSGGGWGENLRLQEGNRDRKEATSHLGREECGEYGPGLGGTEAKCQTAEGASSALRELALELPWAPTCPVLLLRSQSLSGVSVSTSGSQATGPAISGAKAKARDPAPLWPEL